MDRVKILNTEIDNLTMDEAVDEIEKLIKKDIKAYVVTPNIDHIIQLESNEKLREVYKYANLVLTDGKPLIWISKLYKRPIKEKVSGSDLFPRLCERAALKGYKMFFLGAADGVAAEAAKRLAEKYQGLQVVGTYSPMYGFETDSAEINKIIKMICSAEPDILVVGLGAPKQEIFIYEYREQLNVPVSLGLGASLDFEAKKIKRAPKWMSAHGFEWLWRLLHDPRRLAKRYFFDAVKIIPMIIKYRKRK